VWGVKDEFNFVYIEKTGDFDLAARVESLTATHQLYQSRINGPWRSDTRKQTYLFSDLPGITGHAIRTMADMNFNTASKQGVRWKQFILPGLERHAGFPVSFPDSWIRLKRDGNKFTGYTGTDGKSWKEYTSSLSICLQRYTSEQQSLHIKQLNLQPQNSGTYAT